jgi:hypothetical protein
MDTFLWTSGDDMAFTAWDINSPSKIRRNKCMQMRFMYSPVSSEADDIEAEEGLPLNGQWTDIPCRKRNLVVCEKVQNWTLNRVQQNVIKIIRQMKATEVSILNNIIPIGFIYVEMRGQKAPSLMWPHFKWEDVSSEYEGLFFRVKGAEAAPFGVTQNATSPRLTGVQYVSASHECSSDCPILPNNKWSQRMEITPYNGLSSYRSLQFKVSDEEIRPRNEAIRVWKRTG